MIWLSETKNEAPSTNKNIFAFECFNDLKLEVRILEPIRISKPPII